ncbi:MAG TPA: Do family serine endopeptidase [Candidatus Marinimicrobia bacterium]|nr:Do family serine endopeptidase [Candidatus Neomarinimicrobiota bacterium]HJM84446.1 Do family serine endopeptidase [Candidatus Neomarinimicrobiota bacterium]|tara:strand:- start:3618 stop:4979 length:1362 start_codon:yes stop_codon:yes gene_type:complete
MKNTLPLIWITFLLAFPSKQEFSEAFIKVASNGNPAVVSIVSEKVIEQHYNQFFSPFGDQFPQGESRGHSLGSGVIIDSDEGYIITNNHVIDDAEDIKVILYDKREVKGTIVATDPPSDLAVIKVDPNGLATVALGNSDQLSAGEWVVAIGSPFGLHLNHTVTAGIVSAVGRSSVMSRNNFEDFIQHDAAINPGNSGGALFNLDGELVGINTAIATDGFSRANAGVGFAIPINMVKRVMEDLISDGKVTRGWLGVQIQDVDDGMAKALELDDRNGAIISQVIQNSPAEDAGVKEQDVIIEVDGEKVNDSSNLKNLISSGRPNDKTKLTVIRDGREKYLTVILGLRPGEKELTETYRYGEKLFDILGLRVETFENRDPKNLDYVNGVKIVEVKKDSPAFDNNIKRGDIITEMGKTNIKEKDEYDLELESYSKGNTIMLRIVRNGNPLYVAFEIE